MSERSPITTHVLDTASGKPAAGLGVKMSRKDKETWTDIAKGVTDTDGRISNLLPAGSLEPGTYRLHFETGNYFPDGFYPYAEIVFQIKETKQHYHVPLLLSPFAYSTYRGS